MKTQEYIAKKGVDLAADMIQGKTGVPVRELASLVPPETWGKAKEVAQGWWNTMGAPAKQGALDFLTTTAQEGGKHPRFANKAESDRFQNVRSVGDPYLVREGGKDIGYDQRYKKAEGEYPGWAKGLYENPETVSGIAGHLVPTAALVGTGSAINWWAQGEKPRSNYAYPVEPSRGGYNSSVESAEASAFYKHQLEEQKFAHKMELMQAREQSRTPGVQSPMGSSPSNLSSADPFGMDMFGGGKRYF